MFTVKFIPFSNKTILYIKEINDCLVVDTHGMSDGEYILSKKEIFDMLSESQINEIATALNYAEDYINDKKPKNRTPVEYTLCLHPSRTCNMACKYCFARSDESSYLPSKNIDFDITKKAIDFLVNDVGKDGYKYRIDISGSGEPLLNIKYIRELEKYCNELKDNLGKEIYITFPTNATLINKEIAEFLNKSQTIFLGISLDGDELHCKNRLLKDGSEGFEKIKSGIELLNRTFGIAATITNINEDVDQVYDYLYYNFPNADAISMQLVRNYDNSDVSFYNVDINNLIMHYEKLLDKILVHLDNNNYDYVLKLLRSTDTLGVYLRWVLNKRIIHTKRCNAGGSSFSIDDDGSIYSCSALNGNNAFKVGHIDQGVDLRLKSKFSEKNVDNNIKCKNCWASYICGGECFAKAFLSNGDIDIPNERMCEFKKKLIEKCIVFVELLKLKNYEAYLKLKAFRVDSSKYKTHLWAINYFLNSKGISCRYNELNKRYNNAYKSDNVDEVFDFIKNFYKNINKCDISEFCFCKAKFPVIFCVNKNSLRQYLIIDGIDENKFIINRINSSKSYLANTKQLIKECPGEILF